MLVERLLRHARVKHQPENVEVGMLMPEQAADQRIARQLQNPVVEDRILPREGRIADALVRAVPDRHAVCDGSQLRQALRLEPRGCGSGRIRLELEPQLIDLVEAALGDLRRRAVADEVRLSDEPLRLQPAQRLADRRLRDIELARQTIDGIRAPGAIFRAISCRKMAS